MKKLKPTNEEIKNPQINKLLKTTNEVIGNPKMKQLKIHKWKNWKSTNEKHENTNEVSESPQMK